MTSVLVVDDDAQLRAAVARDLEDNGFEVRVAESVQDALAALREAAVDVLLTDLRMSDEDGIDLLDQVRHASGATRPILMSAYATARDHQTALELGAVRVLCKPFTSTELLLAIQQAVDCETGVRGSVHGLSLVDLLQMFHFGRRSISIAVGAPVTGEIHMKDGELVHAACAELQGEDALRALLATPSGSINTAAFHTEAHTVTRPFQSLLLDALRQLDESEKDDAEVFELDGEWPDPLQDAAFSPPAASGVFDALCARLPAIAPEATVTLYRMNSGETTQLQGADLPPEGLDVAVLALAEQISRLDADWQQFESVSHGVAFSLIRCSAGECVVIVMAPLIGRYATVKFRAQTGRIAALI